MMNQNYKYKINLNKLISKNTYLCHLNMSNLPIAGEPIKIASNTTMPKIIPTITKRLFTIKNNFIPDKNEMGVVNFPIWI
jgi:hypothetical protein